MLPQDLLARLSSTIKKNQFKGWDPFDGLNSRTFQKLPLNNYKLFRLLWIQLFKRSPINFRSLTGVKKEYNIKGLSLFLFSYLLGGDKKEDKKKEIDSIIKIIINHRSLDRAHYCWGYNFPWQARAFTVKSWEPNIIVSSFVAQAFVDLYEIRGDEKFLDIAKSVGNFISDELILFESSNEMCFGYIPNKKARVHNANLMGGKLFARLYSITKNVDYKESALKSARYTVSHQQSNGAWVYGELNYHKWIDNFHTGYNLVALNEIARYTATNSFHENIKNGLKFHLNNHFEKDMTPKYFEDKLYPIDIHNYAQGIITCITFGYKHLAEKILNKAVELMWDHQNQYFYYQKTKWYTNKINYMRWSQAWMFYAISRYINEYKND